MTLLEVLVVIGILAALAAILLPAVGKARESARRATCLSNVHALTSAALLYMSDNDGYLPDAAVSNSFESPQCPLTNAKPPGARAFNGFPVLATIGQLLSPYLNSDGRVWRCPSAPEGKFILAGPDPYGGMQAPNAFVPNYHYLGDKEYLKQAMLNNALTQQVKLRVWAARNVAGLRINRIVPLGNPRVVLFNDHDSTYHSTGNRNIYTETADWHYYGNFGYLDGHAEGRSYKNVDEYIACIHGPIRQSWWGVDFASAFPEQYTGY